MEQKFVNLISKLENELEDKNFKEIRRMSAQYFELAKKKIDGKDINENVDTSKEIQKLGELLQKVNSYNKKKAQELVSETVLDINFISKSNVNVSSLRLYHYINSKRR